MHWPTRLSQKLILSLTVVVTLVVVANGIFAVRSAETQLQATMLQGVDQLSGAIASATWHAMLADNRESAYQVMETIAAKQGIRSVRIFNKEGRVMFSTPPSPTKAVDKNAEACFLCHASEQPLVRVDTPTRARVVHRPDGTRTLAMITPIYNEPACSNAACHAHPATQNVLGVLDVGLDMRLVDEQVRRIEVRTALFTSLAIVLVGLCAAVFTRRFVTKPLARLADATRHVAEMQLDRPIALASSEELAELARSFNEMRLRLAEAMAEINGFTRSLEEKVEERTEQLKVAQQKLMQADRLASLGQLSASVAHEINNPLSGRPQPLDAHAADPEGRRHPEGAGGRVPEVPRPGRHRDGPDGAHRLRPPRLLAAEQAPPRGRRPERDRRDDALPRLAQAEADERRGRVRPRRRAPAPPRRRLAAPAGRHEPRPERRRGDPEEGGRAPPRRDAGQRGEDRTSSSR